MIGAVLAATLLRSADDPQPSPTPKPERGVVCPYLREAFEQLETGNEVAFAATVRTAGREAELTLQRSGQLFGRPEEIALHLRAVVDDPDEGSARTLIDEAQRVCASLGRWG